MYICDPDSILFRSRPASSSEWQCCLTIHGLDCNKANTRDGGIQLQLLCGGHGGEARLKLEVV